MAERRGRVSEQVSGHLGRASSKALTPASGADDTVTQLEAVASEAWLNLVGRDGYLPVLLLLLLAMVLPPLVGDSHLGALVSILVGGMALVLTVYRSTHRIRVRRVVLSYVVLAAVAAVISWRLRGSEAFVDEHRLALVLSLNLLVLLMAFPLVILRAFQHRRITVNTVCATLSAYLIIGLLFATTYRLFDQLAPPFFAQYEAGGDATSGQFTYFSFIVLTTVGFGDLTPGSDAARAFVMVEAVIGQIFLVTMLARVVAMLGAQRPVYEASAGDAQRLGVDQPGPAGSTPPPDDP